jgi:hypothetical protein
MSAPPKRASGPAQRASTPSKHVSGFSKRASALGNSILHLICREIEKKKKKTGNTTGKFENNPLQT